MTVHPMVGVFGSTYMIVFGAFLFRRSVPDEETHLSV